MGGRDETPDDEDTVIVASDDTVRGHDATVISSDETAVPRGAAPSTTGRTIESPLSDDDRKRFFRPPVAPPGTPVALTSKELPPTTQPVRMSEVTDEPRKRSFDEIIAGEIHRVTDSIPIIGRNRKGEPRRAAVAIGLVLAVAVVAGVVITLVISLAVR